MSQKRSGKEEGGGGTEQGGRRREEQWLRSVPEAQRQRIGFAEGHLLSGTPD